MLRTARAGRGRPALIVTLAIVAAVAAAATAQESPAQESPGSALVGRTAPAFTAARLQGDSLTLGGQRGSFVLLNFWGPACPPCIAESPHLQRLHRKYEKRGLRIVGVTQMNPKRADIEKFVRKKHVTYTIVLDPGESIGALYGVAAHPTSVLVDPEGNVRWVRAGYLAGDEKEMEALIVQALESRSRQQP